MFHLHCHMAVHMTEAPRVSRRLKRKNQELMKFIQEKLGAMSDHSGHSEHLYEIHMDLFQKYHHLLTRMAHMFRCKIW